MVKVINNLQSKSISVNYSVSSIVLDSLSDLPDCWEKNGKTRRKKLQNTNEFQFLVEKKIFPGALIIFVRSA